MAHRKIGGVSVGVSDDVRRYRDQIVVREGASGVAGGPLD